MNNLIFFKNIDFKILFLKINLNNFLLRTFNPLYIHSKSTSFLLLSNLPRVTLNPVEKITLKKISLDYFRLISSHNQNCLWAFYINKGSQFCLIIAFINHLRLWKLHLGIFGWKYNFSLHMTWRQKIVNLKRRFNDEMEILML